jgi:hypothetical protein
MGLSETIIAAIIGALATMATAIVQILRNRAPSDTRPKKNRVRSTFAIVLLMLGCIVGGYFWSELRAVGAKEEIAALRAELKLGSGTANAAEAGLAAGVPSGADAQTPTDTAVAKASRHSQAGSSESSAHLPPCRLTAQLEDAGPSTCSSAAQQSVALCAAVPNSARTASVHVFARVPGSESPWLERDAGAATLGSLHIADKSFEYAASAEQRAVCLEVANWSVDETLAVRVVVDYDFEAGAAELTAATPGGQSL